MSTTELGQPLPLPTPSPEMRLRLGQRRSAAAQSLSGPGPTSAEVESILTIGARTPDHGKLFPWRFMVLGPETRAAISEQLAVLAERKGLPAKSTAVLAKLANPPLTVLVVSRPTPDHKVPVWEQELSAGAVCMNLEHAADAYGYSASWITDWYAYDVDAVTLFGLSPGERIAGFIHIGTAPEAPMERVRPDLALITTYRP
ncbi:nitroreductase family protein [Brevundimonas sp. VNH65]|uniref:nitroreductase family protein n=1 Tax=Brevundimonas sp. VNH65 TaxID=3400917 RepID=UPI003C01B50D